MLRNSIFLILMKSDFYPKTKTLRESVAFCISEVLVKCLCQRFLVKKKLFRKTCSTKTKFLF